MEKCYVCGKEGKWQIECDNSCGTKVCSDACMIKDTHHCGQYCSECDHMMVMVNNNWFCNYCKKNQTPKPEDDDLL